MAALEPAEETINYPTIFDSKTCLRKGLCQVSRTRTPTAHNLYYEIHGQDAAEEDAELIVFIMGLNNSSFGWHNQIRYFAQKPGYHTLVMDNRGVGNSDTPGGLYKTSEMALDIKEVLEYIGWLGRRLHIVGVSMGGMIAQELALLIPDHVLSLTLVSTTAGNKSASPASGVRMFAKLLFVRDTQTMINIVIDGLYPARYLDAPSGRDTDGPGETNRERLNKEFLHRNEITRKQPISGRLSQTWAALGHRVSPDKLIMMNDAIPKIAVLTGDCDTIVNPERSTDLHTFLPKSEYILFEGGGHALLSQFALRFNETLERIIKEGRAGAGVSTTSA